MLASVGISATKGRMHCFLSENSVLTSRILSVSVRGAQALVVILQVRMALMTPLSQWVG